MPWMFEMFPEINEALYYKNFQQSVASIHEPLGYGPSTLPLRHSAIVFRYLVHMFSLKYDNKLNEYSTKIAFNGELNLLTFSIIIL